MSPDRAELTSFLEGLPEPHILCDPDYRIVAANQAYRHLYGGEGELTGRTCYEVSHHFDRPCDQAGESCPMARARESGQRERILHLHHTSCGQSYVNIELTPLLNPRGEMTGYIEKMETVQHAHLQPQAQGLIGRSPAFRQMLALVMRIAPTDSAVMLLGETGTGKDLVAQTLHASSQRAAKPFVPVDCSSLTETLFESELFGHERGAFTDAHRAKAGLVETAHEGTLFLDEVGDIPLTMQVKLLRLLENGVYRRVGSTEQRQADVRIISATHRDLPTMVREGRFREDLYHRLCTFPIRLPPLRARADDLPLLADSLLSRLMPQRRIKLTSDALELLGHQPFHGNVRELRNLLERAIVLTDDTQIGVEAVEWALQLDRDLLKDPQDGAKESTLSGSHLPMGGTAEGTLRGSWQRLRVEQLRERLQGWSGTRTELARELGVSERTLYRKLKALGMV
ncbi:sigma-54 interaction domain-containing protein [Malikia granosa]|uniref:sigma-54 interaction domain-containing protein n=1 Tax=Malikia granosa TaxID=263067 RepID=UPI001FE33A9E|nr:sigma-54-dependent Fis family transcriptional regulator [Malikia granosa]